MVFNSIDKIKWQKVQEVNQAFIEFENKKRQEVKKPDEDIDDNFKKIFEEELKK